MVSSIFENHLVVIVFRKGSSTSTAVVSNLGDSGKIHAQTHHEERHQKLKTTDYPTSGILTFCGRVILRFNF